MPFHPITVWDYNRKAWEDWEVDLHAVGIAKLVPSVAAGSLRGVVQRVDMRELYICNLPLRLLIRSSDWDDAKNRVAGLPFWPITAWDSTNIDLIHADINPYIICTAKPVAPPKQKSAPAHKLSNEKDWRLWKLYLRGIDRTLLVSQADWETLKQVLAQPLHRSPASYPS